MRIAEDGTGRSVSSKALSGKLDRDNSDGRTMPIGASEVGRASVFSPTQSLVS